MDRAGIIVEFLQETMDRTKTNCEALQEALQTMDSTRIILQKLQQVQQTLDRLAVRVEHVEGRLDGLDRKTSRLPEGGDPGVQQLRRPHRPAEDRGAQDRPAAGCPRRPPGRGRTETGDINGGLGRPLRMGQLRRL